MKLTAIAGFRLVTANPLRLATFYQTIGFAVGEGYPIGHNEMRLLGLEGQGFRLPLTLGNSHLALDWFDVAGRGYPGGARAADTVFQHLAIVTDDADGA